jgi:hypothetical protein
MYEYCAGKHWSLDWMEENQTVTYFLRSRLFTYNIMKNFTLGDISFKLETKIMNFMSGFFRKKYNQVNSSVVNNMQYFLFTIFPLSGPFAEFFS